MKARAILETTSLDARGRRGKAVPARGVQRDRLVASFAAVIVGLLLFLPGLGGWLDGFSFDLLFRTRFVKPPAEVVLISLDAESYEDLNEPKGTPLNRKYLADLLNRLAVPAARPKVVVFDMVFDDAKPAQDGAFAEALKTLKVVLGAEYVRATRAEQARLILPVPALRTNASAWGLVNLELAEGWTARSYRVWDDVSELAIAVPQGRARSFALAAWEEAGYGTAEQLGAPPRVWLNYYGRRDTLAAVSFSDALDPKRAPDRLFKDKVVFVGNRLSIGNAGAGKDEFATPYSMFDHSATHGVEIHATAFLNLLHHEWLTRAPLGIERGGIVLLAALFGALFINWPPYRGLLIALLATMLVMVLAWYGFVWRQVWFAWVKIVVVIAAAFGWAVIYNLYRAHIENILFRKTISRHLSPSMVARALKDPESFLTLGGERRVAVYLFMDVANSMVIAERGSTNPLALVREWNAYYELAAGEIHAQDGMLAKFLGDGIFAMWNVPFEQPDFRRRALIAAVGLKDCIGDYQATSLGMPFHTRIGLHCGESVVGNCGGKERFEYTAMGLAVGTAARLEAANKKLGTHLLASHETVTGLEAEFRLREIGCCELKGVDRTVRLYEVLGLASSTPRAEWLQSYDDGLKKFRARDFAGATVCFQRTLTLKAKAGDATTEIYLRQSEAFQAEPPPAGWVGECLKIS